ncbi:MAG: class II aldolase/adducin family protein [Bacteroidales bacterium]|nr:class II aldolase/adducin family protein [Bacteroidales bacterium]
MIFKDERKTVAKTMRRLYKQRLTTSSGGNVSMRNSDGYVFITASQTDKSCIKWQEIIVFDPKGKNLTPELKPSMEFAMHQDIYKTRTDIFAIVHAHPVFASTFAVTDIQPVASMTGEARFVLGEIAMVDYKLMGTKDLAKACASSLKNAETAIMKNHGAICIGNSLFQAFDRMEVLEFTCQMYFNTLLLKNCKMLKENELKRIDDLK